MVRGIAAALDAGVDSTFHEDGHQLLAELGLPIPTCGQVIVPGTGATDCLLRRPTATRPPLGLVVQWDGIHHRIVTAKRRHDRYRDRLIDRGGYYVEHIDHPDMAARAAVSQRLMAAWLNVMDGVWPPPRSTA